jgi:hypothetical protein
VAFPAYQRWHPDCWRSLAAMIAFDYRVAVVCLGASSFSGCDEAGVPCRLDGECASNSCTAGTCDDYDVVCAISGCEIVVKPRAREPSAALPSSGPTPLGIDASATCRFLTCAALALEACERSSTCRVVAPCTADSGSGGSGRETWIPPLDAGHRQPVICGAAWRCVAAFGGGLAFNPDRGSYCF